MEDFKIPENLSRFAVKAGMWGFIKKMSPYMQLFIADRRMRGVDSDSVDPQGFGAPSTIDEVKGPAGHTPVRCIGYKHRTLQKVTCGAAAIIMIALLGHGGDRYRRKGKGSRQEGIS